MLMIFIIFLVLILTGAVVCIVMISKIQNVYSQMWGTDETIPTWQRKRWAFVLIAAAHLIGFYGLVWPHPWISVVYIALICTAVWGFVDSYRLLLKDMRLLPKK